MKRVMVRFKGVREKGAMSFVECQGLFERHDGGPPVEGELRQLGVA